jgi:hypothetical protein
MHRELRTSFRKENKRFGLSMEDTLMMARPPSRNPLQLSRRAAGVGEDTIIAAALVTLSLLTAGCQDGDHTPATPCTPGGPGTIDPGPCEPDPLLTNLDPLWNGNSVDAYDCPILEYTALYGEPDAMIFKAIIYVESRFQYDAVGCTGRGPCCPEIGWSSGECACLGIMQNGPECGATSGPGLLSNGHPNMQTDPSCVEFENSVFNPAVNIHIGISIVAGNRVRMKETFPGCTEDQYTLMAVGEYNHYRSTQSCTAYNVEYLEAVLEAYNEYSTAAGWPAHPYVAQ